MAIPQTQILDLFDGDDDEQELCLKLTDFLAEHKRRCKDLVVYYVGHGGFTDDKTYYLAIKNTRNDQEFLTALEANKLARAIKAEFRHGRVYIILDCCFAAAAVRHFQTSDIMHAALSGVSRELPESGTAFLAAASKDDVASAPIGEPYTRFTGALLSVLNKGMWNRSSNLSLSDVYDGIRDELKTRKDKFGGAPELHSPHQKKGNVAQVGLFPNPSSGVAGDALPLSRPSESAAHWPLFATLALTTCAVVIAFVVLGLARKAAPKKEGSSPGTPPLTAPITDTKIAQIPWDRWIADENPFVSVFGISVQQNQVTQFEYQHYLKTLSDLDRRTAEPLNEPDRSSADSGTPVGWTTHEQASSFCGSLGARLPSEAEWKRLSRGQWGLGLFPGGQVGPYREWTSTVTNGAALVAGGDFRMSGDQKRQALVSPLRKITQSTARTTGDTRAASLSGPTIGFRCVRP